MHHVSCQNRRWQILAKTTTLELFRGWDSERIPNIKKKTKYFSFIQAYKELGLHMTHSKHNTTLWWISIEKLLWRTYVNLECDLYPPPPWPDWKEWKTKSTRNKADNWAPDTGAEALYVESHWAPVWFPCLWIFYPNTHTPLSLLAGLC